MEKEAGGGQTFHISFSLEGLFLSGLKKESVARLRTDALEVSKEIRKGFLTEDPRRLQSLPD